MNGLVMLAQQFIGLMDPMVLLILLLSTLLGVIIGALPGLSATMGIALLTGLTYKFPLDYTFAILMGVYVGAIYGGSMSAILLNIPGTASAIHWHCKAKLRLPSRSLVLPLSSVPSSVLWLWL